MSPFKVITEDCYDTSEVFTYNISRSYLNLTTIYNPLKDTLTLSLLKTSEKGDFSFYVQASLYPSYRTFITQPLQMTVYTNLGPPSFVVSPMPAFKVYVNLNQTEDES